MNVIGEIDYPSHVMQRVLAACRHAAQTLVIVLLLGESGTGKDYLSRYIHRHSARSCGPFFAVDCAAVAEELAESELFGHERGAFTGAVCEKKGLLELAAGGTLLLNEFGEMGLGLQAKFLSFLEPNDLGHNEFVRVGGQKSLTVDTRIIVATNKDLEQLSRQGRFRQDLYYRVNVFPIQVPPLRDRKEDIPVLVRHLLSRSANKIRLGYTPDVDVPALQELASYDWPGNIRELRNILERLLIQNCGNHRIDRKMVVSALNDTGNSHYLSKDLDKPNSVKISDELLKRVIEEVFDDAPTPVTVLCEVLGWKRKQTSTAVKRVGCSGKPGRIPKAAKKQMLSAVREWLKKNGIQ